MILSDDADRGHFTTSPPPSRSWEGVQARKKKFIFRKSTIDGRPETRASSWEMFFGDRLETDPDTCRKFQDEVRTRGRPGRLPLISRIF